MNTKVQIPRCREKLLLRIIVPVGVPLKVIETRVLELLMAAVKRFEQLFSKNTGLC